MMPDIVPNQADLCQFVKTCQLNLHFSGLSPATYHQAVIRSQSGELVLFFQSRSLQWSTETGSLYDITDTATLQNRGLQKKSGFCKKVYFFAKRNVH